MTYCLDFSSIWNIPWIHLLPYHNTFLEIHWSPNIPRLKRSPICSESCAFSGTGIIRYHFNTSSTTNSISASNNKWLPSSSPLHLHDLVKFHNIGYRWRNLCFASQFSLVYVQLVRRQQLFAISSMSWLNQCVHLDFLSMAVTHIIRPSRSIRSNCFRTSPSCFLIIFVVPSKNKTCFVTIGLRLSLLSRMSPPH